MALPRDSGRVLMASRPILLDLFCGAGGASMGYYRAGFDVVGVDHLPHPDYPFPMVLCDAMDWLSWRGSLDAFDVVHASPPCPRYASITRPPDRTAAPDLVAPVRAALVAWGGPYVIENVPGAPLVGPVLYCGRAMGLPHIKRHRLFESSVFLMSPGCACGTRPPLGVYGHAGGTASIGRKQRATTTRLGHHWPVRDAAHAREVMGIDWMTRWDDLTDAIPPAYTEHIGVQLAGVLSSPAPGLP